MTLSMLNHFRFIQTILARYFVSIASAMVYLGLSNFCHVFVSKTSKKRENNGTTNKTNKPEDTANKDNFLCSKGVQFSGVPLYYSWLCSPM